jgi:hypothetical protein
MEGEWRGRETAARPRRVGSGELFCWLLGRKSPCSRGVCFCLLDSERRPATADW